MRHIPVPQRDLGRRFFGGRLRWDGSDQLWLAGGSSSQRQVAVRTAHTVIEPVSVAREGVRWYDVDSPAACIVT